MVNGNFFAVNFDSICHIVRSIDPCKNFRITLFVSRHHCDAFWFHAAKLNSGVKDRVVINKNDWFDLERLYPSIYTWNKNDIWALKDRIGILLANVEFRKSESELCNRIEAIEVAFQLSVYYWEEEYFTKDDTYVYMVTGSIIRLIDINTNQELEVFSLGFSQPTDSISALKTHYRSLNQVSL